MTETHPIPSIPRFAVLATITAITLVGTMVPTTPASADNSPPVVTGQVLADDGSPLHNARVVLEAWPDDEELPAGSVINMVQIGSSRSQPDGTFKMRTPLTGRIQRIVGGREGQLNLRLTVIDDGRAVRTHMSRWWNRESRTWVSDMDGHVRDLDLGDFRIDGTTADFPAVNAEELAPNQCHTVATNTFTNQTVTVDQLHTPTDTRSARSGMTKSGSVALSVMVKAGSGSWSASGSQAATNSSSHSEGLTTSNSNYSRRLLTKYTFRSVTTKCPTGNQYTLRPHQWEGGMTWGSQTDYGCSNSQYRRTYGKGAYIERSSGQDFQQTGAASVSAHGATASMSVKSTFGSSKSMRIDMGTATSYHYLCGSNNYPASNPDRIYAT